MKRITKEKYYKNPKRCLHCGKIIPYEKRCNLYCNSSCFASENNIGKCRNEKYYDALRGYPKQKKEVKHRSKIPIDKTISCLFCGKRFIPSSKKVRFCNANVCRRLYETEQVLLSGAKTLDHKNKKGVKKYLLYKRGNICEDCGRSEWKCNGTNNEVKPIPLEIHHMNGNIDDMRLENLKLLCPNCHSFTDNFTYRNSKKYKAKMASFCDDA
jgi:hypothetical protein